MKLAISTQEPNSESPVALRFGRARYLLVLDLETGQRSAIDNGNGVQAAQGAALQAVQALSRRGVQVVLTGYMGPKIWTALNAAKIKTYSASRGSAKEAVQAFVEGRLRPMSPDDVEDGS